MILEQIDRAFSGLAERDDFYFRVELTGIGKIFDLSY